MEERDTIHPKILHVITFCIRWRWLIITGLFYCFHFFAIRNAVLMHFAICPCVLLQFLHIVV